MENNQSIFEVKNVDLFYGEHQALKSINLNIEKNKVTAFIGPSGCGKSTLLRCFNKMNDLISGCKVTGEIIFDGTDINLMNTIELRTKVGMVFQNPNPFPMSIFDNVAYGPRCSGIKNQEKLKEIVIDSLKKASLYEEVKDRLKSSALSLSGGQQQRLCIARAIAMKPEVILSRVLNQINEQFGNDEIFVTIYGKKMDVDFIEGHAHIYIDLTLDTQRYTKLVLVNSLLKKYLF